MFVTAAPSTSASTTTATTTTSLPLSLSMSSPSGIQLKDCTLGDSVCAQEWIARELGRIQQNTKPRHCHDYEALLQVIDDMSRFLQAPGGAAAASRATEIAAEAAEAEVFQQQTPILRLVDLEHAMVRVVRFSQRYGTSRHQSHPYRLVLALDDMVSRRQLDGGKMNDTASAQHQLFSILFGQVQLSAQLVEPWKMICQWAKQLARARDWHLWMGYGIDTYTKAKERCHLRVEAGAIITTTSGAASDPSSTSSTPSISATSRDEQIVLEQLQELLLTNNNPLAEKYSA